MVDIANRLVDGLTASLNQQRADASHREHADQQRLHQQIEMVRRDADERANLQAQLAATAQRLQLQQQAEAEQMQLQQQAAEEKLRQAELPAEEKRQRSLLEFQLQQLQSTTTIQTTHRQAHDDRPHTPLQPNCVQSSSELCQVFTDNIPQSRVIVPQSLPYTLTYMANYVTAPHLDIYCTYLRAHNVYKPNEGPSCTSGPRAINLCTCTAATSG